MSKNSVISTRHRHLDTGVNMVNDNHFDNSRSGAATFHATRNFMYNFLLVTRKRLAHRLTVREGYSEGSSREHSQFCVSSACFTSRN